MRTHVGGIDIPSHELVGVLSFRVWYPHAECVPSVRFVREVKADHKICFLTYDLILNRLSMIMLPDLERCRLTRSTIDMARAPIK